MILLAGATSRLGRAIADRLVEARLPFKAACRDPAKANRAPGSTFEVLRMDLETGAGVDEAMLGTRSVITCIHGLLGRSRHAVQRVDIEGHRRLIDSAAVAGVARFVYTSALGASPHHPSEFWKAKAATEEYLKASGLDYVILRPSAFMDLYAHDLIGAAVLRRKTVFILGTGTTQRNMIAVADVARAAIEAVTRDDLAGRTIEIGGWENVTEREVAALYAQSAGVPCKVRSLPPTLLRALAGFIGAFHAGLGRLLRLPAQLAGRPDLRLDASSMIQLGIQPSRLHDFVQGKVDAAKPPRG